MYIANLELISHFFKFSAASVFNVIVSRSARCYSRRSSPWSAVWFYCCIILRTLQRRSNRCYDKWADRTWWLILIILWTIFYISRNFALRIEKFNISSSIMKTYPDNMFFFVLAAIIVNSNSISARLNKIHSASARCPSL